MTQDLSRSGVRVLTRAKVDSGQEVVVSLHFHKKEPATASGIVRRNSEAEERGIWNREVAIEFASPFPQEFEDQVKSLSLHEIF